MNKLLIGTGVTFFLVESGIFFVLFFIKLLEEVIITPEMLIIGGVMFFNVIGLLLIVCGAVSNK